LVKEYQAKTEFLLKLMQASHTFYPCSHFASGSFAKSILCPGAYRG